MINGHTEVCGVIGYPVKHTFSPFMHNSAFKECGINAVYLAFEVAPENLKDAVLGLRALGIKGFNVTIPHKENIIRHLDELSDEAKFLGAVNTVAVRGSKLVGFNTDGLGFIDSLKSDLKMNPKGKSVFIFGAGGAARAISFSLAKEKAKRIVLTDIDSEKAAVLADSISKKTGCAAFAIRFDKNAIKELILNSQLVINASPCGMNIKDPLLINPEWLHRNLAVYDIVYSRFETKLLKTALARGVPSSGGINMLLRQGARAFKLWTNHKPPIDVMKKALARALKK